MIEIRYLVTSALPYVNNELHIGHIAGCILPGDVYSRFLKLKGEKCIYICGSDEYGTPVALAAKKEGLTPKQLADKYHEKQKQAVEGLNINFDIFSRTTSKEHTKVVQGFYYNLKQNNFIYRKSIKQLYCEKCERFLADRYVEGTCPYCGAEGARGDQCDACGKLINPLELKNPKCKICGSKPIVKESEHVFFDLPKLEKELTDWIENHDGLFPNTKKFALNFIKEGLKEKDISRDIEWGVPIPDAPGKVFYVWFDAPIGYITFTKQLGKENWWHEKSTQLVHFLGKDNIPFHSIYFPGMLMAEGSYILPSKIASYEYLTFGGSKLSKSKGTIVKVLDALKEFSADYWRYYLVSNLPEKRDTDFTWESFQETINSELNDTVGNFVNRTLTFAKKYFDSKVEKPELRRKDEEVIKQANEKAIQAAQLIEQIELKKALQEVVEIARIGNQFITKEEPWKKEESRKQVVYTCLHLVKLLSLMLKPFIPESAEKMQDFIGKQVKWSQLKQEEEKYEIREFKVLFKKIDDKKTKELIKTYSHKKNKEVKKMNYVSYDDFAKLDLRVAEVIEVEKIENADKLYKLKIKVGEEERQLVAGMAPYYSEEEIRGKKIIIIANLEPRKIRGIESQGMLLAAEDEKGKVKLLTIDGDIETGAKIR